MNRILLQKIFGKALLCLLFAAFQINVFGQSTTLQFLDKEKGAPIEGILIFNLKNELLGISNEEGIWKDRLETTMVRIKSLGEKDTLIELIPNATNTIILAKRIFDLEGVDIIEKKIDVYAYLMELISKNRENFIEDTVLFYRYTHQATIVDSNWIESFKAPIILHLKNYPFKKFQHPKFFDTIQYHLSPELEQHPIFKERYFCIRSSGFFDAGYFFDNKLMRQIKGKKVEVKLETRTEEQIVFSLRGEEDKKPHTFIYFDGDKNLKKFEWIRQQGVHSQLLNFINEMQYFYLVIEFSKTDKLFPSFIHMSSKEVYKNELEVKMEATYLPDTSTVPLPEHTTMLMNRSVQGRVKGHEVTRPASPE